MADADEQQNSSPDQADHSEAQNPNEEPKQDQSQDQGSDSQKQSNKGKKQGSKSGSKGPKQHPAQALAQNSDENAASAVQPIETVRNKPEVGNEEAETVPVLNKPNLQQDGEGVVTADKDPAGGQKPRKVESSEENCWNCANHGRTTKLRKDGTCPECEFDKSKLYNLNIEQEKARQRALAEAQY